jgi:enoyl-CoA hydratase/carnithine racemase
VEDRAIQSEVSEGIGRITLNAPDRRNALNYQMVVDLIEVLRQFEGDSSVRVILLSAAGKNFSAGGDLQQFAEEVEAPVMHHWEEGALWEELFALVPRMTKPVVAAVQGYALAGGCGLVALSDLVVAADTAKIGTTEIRIGLFPLLILPALRRAVGEKKALEMALTGQIIDAAEAYRIGLVNRVVPVDNLMDEALSLARELANKGPGSMRLGKHCFYATADMSYDDALAFARSLRVLFMVSDDLREGVSAFLEKREPRWGTVGGSDA